MKTFNRICIKDFEVGDEDNSFTIKRGKEYLTSEEDEKGEVTVFTQFWVGVPVSIFAGEEQFT